MILLAKTKEEKQLERKNRKKLEKEKEKRKAKALEEKLERDKNWRLFSDPGFIKFLKSASVWVFSIAFIIFWFVIETGEKHADFRGLPLWYFLGNAVLSGIIIYFGFFRKKDFPLMFKICFVCLALYPWLGSPFESGKLMLAVNFLILVLIVCTEITCGAIGNFFYLAIPLLWFMGVFSRQLHDLSFNLLNYKYLIISGVFSVVISILLDHFREKGIIFPSFENNKKPYIFYLFGISFIVVFGLLVTINYSLDFSEGTSSSIVIEDKYTDINRLGNSNSTYYYFSADYGGEEIVFSVNAKDYNRFEIGDSVTVTEYEGFLGDGYVIVNEELQK